VFLTAKTGRAEMRRGMELGADDYLTKPFTQPELVATIKARFEKQSNLTRIYEERLESLRSNVVRALPHELRTPLTGIMGYSSMLIEDIDSLDQAQIVQMAESIDRAARRLHRLTENYLLYAQIEFLQLDQPRLQALRQASTYDAELVIEDVAQLLGREYKRLDDLKIQLAPQANLQIANETLYKIIYEVIDNAFKFSSAGHTVELVSEWQEQTYCLQVRDQGRGMTPQQIDTIGAYMQFNRRVYEQAGLGLGLVIARRLLEVHHGRLEVTSTPPQGTIIWLYLPQATTTEGVT
jgi:K+-sensing histidine kinase KdpD